MPKHRSNNSSRKRSKRPLNQDRLEEIAMAYVARFSTTSARLKAYLERKIRERGWEDETEPSVDELVLRFVERGFIDDAEYAQMRSRSLLSRGYGQRRIAAALYQAGVSEDISEDQLPDQRASREAVCRYAKKRRFGPYFVGEIDSARREKQLAAMMRAGHDFEHCKLVIDAKDAGELDEWVEEADDELE